MLKAYSQLNFSRVVELVLIAASICILFVVKEAELHPVVFVLLLLALLSTALYRLHSFRSFRLYADHFEVRHGLSWKWQKISYSDFLRRCYMHHARLESSDVEDAYFKESRYFFRNYTFNFSTVTLKAEAEFDFFLRTCLWNYISKRFSESEILEVQARVHIDQNPGVGVREAILIWDSRYQTLTVNLANDHSIKALSIVSEVSHTVVIGDERYAIFTDDLITENLKEQGRILEQFTIEHGQGAKLKLLRPAVADEYRDTTFRKNIFEVEDRNTFAFEYVFYCFQKAKNSRAAV